MPETSMLLVDDIHGVYVPKVWAGKYRMFPDVWNITNEQMDCLLAGPDCESYWDTWDEVLDSAEFKDSQGRVWHLWQDGALWAFCDDGEQFV